MSRKLRGIAPDGTKYVVHFDREWREWQVRAYRKNKAGVWKFAEGPTYYANDREDAEQSFYHLVGHAPAGTHMNPMTRKWRGLRLRSSLRKKYGAARIRRLYKNPLTAKQVQAAIALRNEVMKYGMAVVGDDGTIRWLDGSAATHCGKDNLRTAVRIAADQAIKHARKYGLNKIEERLLRLRHEAGY